MTAAEATLGSKGLASRTPPAALASDLRMDLFAGIFAFGCLHHEVQFVLEQQRVVPLSEYMERWAQVKPSIGWSSEIAIAIHLTVVLASIAVLVLPWRRSLLCLLGLPVLLLSLVSPERISAHYSLMATSVLLLQVLSLAELGERAWQRGRPDSRATDWHGWTLTGLSWLAALTYATAFFHKLNLGWLDPQSNKGPSMLVASVEPFLVLLGYGSERALPLLAPPAIYGTLLIEAALPFLLLHPGTRLLGCFIGIGFHLPMLVQRVGDFPVILMAFYPLFMTAEQARALLRHCVARPSGLRLAATLAFGVFLFVAMTRAEPLMHLRSEGAEPLLLLAHEALSYVTLALFVHVFCVVADLLLRDVNTGLVRLSARTQRQPQFG